MSNLRTAAEQALDALTNCSSEHGHRCNRCDSEVDEGGRVADALRAALAAEQPQPTVGVQACRPADRAMLATPAGTELLTKVAAALTVPQAVTTAPKRIWLQVSDNAADLDEPWTEDAWVDASWCWHSVMDAEVEYVRADLAAPPPAAPEPSEAELPPLPIPTMRVDVPYYDGRDQFYTAEQMREYARAALRAAAAARGK